MKNWKTTVTAIVGVAAYTLTKLVGVEIPEPVQESILVVTIFVVGLFAKDAGNHED